MNARATADDGLDYLDDALVVWAREIPDLDPVTEGIVERIHILAHDFNVSSEETLRRVRPRSALVQVARPAAQLRAAVPALGRDAGQRHAALERRDDQPARPDGDRGPDPPPRRPERPARHAGRADRCGHAAWDQTVGTQARREAMIAAVLTDKEREQLHALAAPAHARLPGQGPRPQARRRPTRPRPTRTPAPASPRRDARTQRFGMTDTTPAIEAVERSRDPVRRRPDRARPQRRGERRSSRASSSRRSCARSSSGAARTTTSSSWCPVAAASTGRRSAPISGSSGCRSPTPTRRSEATGYERGAITPFGAKRAWPVIVDASASGLERVAIGGGAHGVNLHLAPADLVAALGRRASPT